MLVNAIHQCHGNNIMHRDLKPSNIMFDHDGNLKLIDFGRYQLRYGELFNSQVKNFD